MTSRAAKLLERMRRSKAGWKRQHLDTLYKGYGFHLKHGSKHDYYRHPEYPELRDTVKRSGVVAEYSVRNAIRPIDRLTALKDSD